MAQATPEQAPQLAIIDTDIGDDIDDAFALALALRSPELKIVGITTAFGDTELRAKLVYRFLKAADQSDIPIGVGASTPYTNVFTQAAYAKQLKSENGMKLKPGAIFRPDGVGFLLEKIKAHPGQITLIAIGPETNLKRAIDRDLVTFRKLKRVVLMGGSVYRGYGDEHRPPEPEWNIDRDPAAAKALFSSGVSIFMMPLDSTQIHLGAADRERIFSFGSPLTDQLALLYHQWVANTDNHAADPTLFDPVAVTYAIHPDLCPVKPLRIEIDDRGMTFPVPGAPNAQVCVNSDEKGFTGLLLDRLTKEPGK